MKERDTLFPNYSAFLALYSSSEWINGCHHTVEALVCVTKRE